MNNCIDFEDTVPLDSLLRHVLPTISNIPYELGVDLLRQAFTTFCRRTSMLAAEIQIVPQTDVVDYELTPPENYQVHIIRQAGFKQNFIDLPQPDFWYTCYGERFAIVGNKYIIFKTVPSANSMGFFQVVASVIPTECVTRIPREISVPFGQGIAKGALAEALLYKNKPWFDPGLSTKMMREFIAIISAGTSLNLMNRGGSSMAMRARPWA